MALSAYRPSLHAREQINDSCALNKAFCEVVCFFLSFSFSRTNFFVLFFSGLFGRGSVFALLSVLSRKTTRRPLEAYFIVSIIKRGDPLFRLPEWREIRKRVTRDSGVFVPVLLSPDSIVHCPCLQIHLRRANVISTVAFKRHQQRAYASECCWNVSLS